MEQFLQQIANGLSLGSTYAVVALGFGLTFSVMRVINLAHPDLFMLGAYLGYLVTAHVGGRVARTPLALFALVLVVAMVGTGLAGLVIERTVIRPLRGRYVLIPFIATSGVSIALENTVQRIFGADPVPIPEIFPMRVVGLGGVTMTNVQLLVFGAAVAIMLAISLYVRRTRWGRATRAVAERPEIAAACGANINLVSQITVGLSSVSAGVAGVTVGLLQTSAAPFMGLHFGLKSFICMLVAGNRHVEGVMVIGLALGVLEALVAGYVSSTLRDAVAFGLLLAVLVFRPRGIFGSYEL
jgi:branched-chain amino acid transport system permease protein